MTRLAPVIAIALPLVGVAAASAGAQPSRIAVVDWYGVRAVSRAELQALAIEPGDPAPNGLQISRRGWRS